MGKERGATVRHFDKIARLKPESQQKLRRLVRTQSIARVARMLNTSAVTIDQVSCLYGGARQSTIDRLEAELNRVE